MSTMLTLISVVNLFNFTIRLKQEKTSLCDKAILNIFHLKKINI